MKYYLPLMLVLLAFQAFLVVQELDAQRRRANDYEKITDDCLADLKGTEKHAQEGTTDFVHTDSEGVVRGLPSDSDGSGQLIFNPDGPPIPVVDDTRFSTVIDVRTSDGKLLRGTRNIDGSIGDFKEVDENPTLGEVLDRNKK